MGVGLRGFSWFIKSEGLVLIKGYLDLWRVVVIMILLSWSRKSGVEKMKKFWWSKTYRNRWKLSSKSKSWVLIFEIKHPDHKTHYDLWKNHTKSSKIINFNLKKSPITTKKSLDHKQLGQKITNSRFLSQHLLLQTQDCRLDFFLTSQKIS